jgi:hypothetical protein
MERRIVGRAIVPGRRETGEKECAAVNREPTIVTGREKPVAMRTCLNCVYVCCDPCAWLRCHDRGEPLVPRCANHPQWPGQLHDVPGTPCRNYQPKPAEPDDTVRRIPLSNGQFVIVDAADYEWLSQYTWTMIAAGYAGRNEKGKLVLMHRQIMNPPKGMVVDHIDGAILNNRRSNLRICTREQNVRNSAKRRRAASRYKCVGFDKKLGRWFARFRYKSMHLWLGYFDDEAEAARAYDRKAVEYFGEFARLNFPEEWPPERRQEVYANRQVKSDAEKGERKKAKRKSAAPRAKTPARKGRKRLTHDTKGTRKKSPQKARRTPRLQKT